MIHLGMFGAIAPDFEKKKKKTLKKINKKGSMLIREGFISKITFFSTPSFKIKNKFYVIKVTKIDLNNIQSKLNFFFFFF